MSKAIQGKKILFTTVYNNGKNMYDHFWENSRRTLFRYCNPRICSFGLRFIRENIPEIDILEYPSLEEFKERVRGYDIVGFSFFMNETHEILEMAKCARELGVKEVWAGNYGVMTPEIQKSFDRMFIGYSEHDIVGLLGKTIDDIKHPPIVMYYSTSFGIKVNRVGILFTSRGCKMRCKFCQTPRFCSSVEKLSIESIERVLVRYKKMGITELNLYDENFGLLKEHTDAVTRLLQKYGFYWSCQSSARILEANLDSWENRGLIAVALALENFDQEVLNRIQKADNTRIIERLVRELNQRHLFILGYYMIGFESETEESIKRDMKKLLEFRIDMNQICVITPLPMTPLWDELDSEYGIFDRDYHHYDAKHLVWNHPNISPERMEALLDWSFNIVYPRARVFTTGMKFTRKYIKDKGLFGGLEYMLVNMLRANTFDYRGY